MIISITGMAFVIRKFLFNSRSKIASEITSLVYYNDQRTCQQSETFIAGQVHITNGRALRVSADRKRMFKKDEDTIRVCCCT